MGPNRKCGNISFLSSKYYLDYFKTICQDYTHKYDKIEFVDTYRRTNYVDE